MTGTKALLAAGLALALVAAGCGDDGDSGGEVSSELQPYADALADSFEEDPEFPVSEDEVRCFANDTVEVIGIERLEQLGTPEEVATDADVDLAAAGIDQDEAETIAQSFVDCAPGLTDEFRTQFTEGTGEELTEEQEACIDDLLTEDVIVDVIAAGLLGDEEGGTAAFDEIFGDLAACLF